MKKVFSIVLVLVLILSAAITASADGNTKVQNGDTLYWYNGEVYTPVGYYKDGIVLTEGNTKVQNGDTLYWYHNGLYRPVGKYTIEDTSAGNLTEEPYIPHPRFYEETGIEHTKTWTLTVNEGEVLVVGGYNVNDRIHNAINSKNTGVYRAYGPGAYKITVTDGFVSIVDGVWGTHEFDFRVDQAVKYGWDHNLIDPGPITDSKYAD